MSSYTSKAHILGEIQESTLIQLTDDGKTGYVDEGVLAQIISNASGYHDNELGRRSGRGLGHAVLPVREQRT